MASLVSKRVIVLKLENVAQLVFFLRDEKVMFDADLAMLYGVEVRSLNQAVARNRKRFPADFAFRLTDDELAALRSQLVISKSQTSQAGSRLRSQIVTSNTGRRWPTLPALRLYRTWSRDAFQRAAQRAVDVNIAIMRTFVQLRRLMDSNRDLARKIEALEKKYDEQYNVRGRRWIDCIGCMVRQPSGREIASQFAEVFAAIKELVAPPASPRKQIGFHR